MKRPPIEGMPAERPVCPFCGKKLRPCVDDVRVRDEGNVTKIISRKWYGWQGYPNIRDAVFCTLNCSLGFALAAHRAGYRIVRG